MPAPRQGDVRRAAGRTRIELPLHMSATGPAVGRRACASGSRGRDRASRTGRVLAGLTAPPTSPPAVDWQHLGNTAPLELPAERGNMYSDLRICAHSRPCDRLLAVERTN